MGKTAATSKTSTGTYLVWRTIIYHRLFLIEKSGTTSGSTYKMRDKATTKRLQMYNKGGKVVRLEI